MVHEIGLVGLDSSHPEAFAAILSERDDATIAAVWDGGAVRSDEYAAEFCDRHGAIRYDDPAEMAGAVDGAMVLTVDWDTHASLAEPFLTAGLPTFVDKPLAGCLADVEAIADLARNSGAGLAGGSALPFHPAVSDLAAGEGPRTVYCAGYGDPFFYGVHPVDAVRSLVGVNWTSVDPRSEPGQAVSVRFVDGSVATLRFDGSGDDASFGVLSVGDRTRTAHVEGTEEELHRMYDPFIDAFVDVVEGRRDDRDRLVDGASLLLAVDAALESGNPVTPGSDAVAAVAKDGAAFLADYSPYY